MLLNLGNLLSKIYLLNATKSWKFTFKDLPAYKEGKLIKYNISEDVVSGYTTVIGNATVGNFTVTNTHVANVTEVNVTKVWNDENDYDHIRPKNVTIQLLADGVKVNETILNATNGWKFTFSNLPVNKNGSVINYTIVEVDVRGYNSTINYNSTNITVVNTHIRPDMTVEKLTLNKTVIIGNDVYFMIVVTNTGNCDLSDVKVSEIFNSNNLTLVDYNNKSLWSMSGDVFTYYDVLAPGESVNFTIWFTTLVNGTVINTVNASSNMTDNKTANNNTTVYKPNMTVEKLALNNTVTVYVGNLTAFKVIVTNTGDCDLSDVVVSEIYNHNQLKFARFSGDGWINSTDVYRYGGVLKPGESANFTIWFTTLVNGTIINTVNASSNVTDNKTANNETRVYKPNMTVQKLALNKTVTIGEQTIFTIVVTNTGDCVLGNITVREEIPQGLQYNTFNGLNWEKIGDYIFKYNVNLAPGNSTSFNITFDAKEGGNWTNIVYAKSNITEEKPANNTTFVNGPGIEVEKLALNTTVIIGDQISFIVNVTNTGNCVLHNVTVTEIYKLNELSYVNHTNKDLWIKSGNIFKYKGNLAAGQSVVFTIVFDTLVNGTLVNTVNATSDETDNVTAKNKTLVIRPNMTVEKLTLNKTIIIGDNVYFMIVVKNTGDCNLSDVKVTEIYDSNKLTLVDFDNKSLWSMSGDVF